MSTCSLDLLIENINHRVIIIKNDLLDFGLENNQSTLYLEAISEDGKKFNFYRDGSYEEFSTDKDVKLNGGSSTTKQIRITDLYHFPYEGNYQIRIVLRPSNNVKGLEKNYYSNWEKLTVIKDYRTDEGWEEGY